MVDRLFHSLRRPTARGLLAYAVMSGVIGILLVPRGISEDPHPPLFVTADRCLACHNDLIAPSGEDISIGSDWRSSIMAHSAKDPYWQAAVRREIMDHPESQNLIEDECAACHMPMARFEAKTRGELGKVLAHLPINPGGNRLDRLAAEGVSCAMCHQIQEEGLGEEESFTAGFEVDEERPIGERAIYGPFEVDAGRTKIMHSASEFRPVESAHIQSSELCATCHTLYTHALGSGGEVIGELPEQVPYLEWRHSAFRDTHSCQSCHMPEVEMETPIASVLGEPRAGFSRHSFRGGNFFMLRMLNRYRADLGVDALLHELEAAAVRTEAHLSTDTARVSINRGQIVEGRLELEVRVENLAGHKLPTAYPSRRAWLHLTVHDARGELVFESGRFEANGSIQGNDNDRDASLYEPHYRAIDDPEKVQIYESIMVDSGDSVTTGLLSAVRFIKDNRLLPLGFDKTTAATDIAVRGGATQDDDFEDGRDRVLYSVQVAGREGPYTVYGELWYQPIAYRWAQNLKDYDAFETRRFLTYYESMAQASAMILARAQAVIR